jgi:hypothetical protein
MNNDERLAKIKTENELLYNKIIERRVAVKDYTSPFDRLEKNGWIEIDGIKLYSGGPKWLTNLTIDELRIRAREYEKPRKPESICINNIPIHKNQNNELLEGEIFKKNDEKDAEVSNLGRVKHGDYILEQYDPKNNGYLFVDINNNPERVYRLIAETWIERPKLGEFPDLKWFYYNTVHHISNNGYDNRIENLMWVTAWQHAMIHPWMDFNKFDIEELDTLLSSYKDINITPNDYQRIINITKRIQQLEDTLNDNKEGSSGGYKNFWIDIIEAMEELKDKARTSVV